MAKYIATVLIDIDDRVKLDYKKSSVASITGLLESRIKAGAVDELIFRNGRLFFDITEVKIVVMEIE